jgi:hypothetical protein
VGCRLPKLELTTKSSLAGHIAFRITFEAQRFNQVLTTLYNTNHELTITATKDITFNPNSGNSKFHLSCRSPRPHEACKDDSHRTNTEKVAKNMDRRPWRSRRAHRLKQG